MHSTAIKPGDRFRKTDAVSSTVWIVTRVIRTPGVPTHFMLTDTAGRHEVRTISEPTLVDRSYYYPVPPEPTSDDRRADDQAQPRQDGSVRERGTASDHGGSDARSLTGWLDDLGLSGIRIPGSSRAR